MGNKVIHIELEAELVWSEDDATVYQRDHESTSEAFHKLTGKYFQDCKLDKIQPLCESDCDFVLITIDNKCEYLVLRSFPGDSSIYKLTRAVSRSFRK